MRNNRKLQGVVVEQLEGYTKNKALLKVHEEISIYIRNPENIGRSGNLPADPTGAQAIARAEDPELAALRGWVWAIEETWETLRESTPNKAFLMELLFGLNGNKTRWLPGFSRETIVAMLHISEPTIYRWREEIVTLVMTGAIQAGVLKPFGADGLMRRRPAAPR